MNFVEYWSDQADIPATRFINWLAISTSKYYDWKTRHGKPNCHNGRIPKAFWLMQWEKDAIINYFQKHSDEGYRRLSFMMLDADVVAVSPSSVYRVLTAVGLLRRWNPKTSSKGDGFQGPSLPHEHWHTDISYLNISGTFYYLCTALDGYSRYIVHWEIREAMTEADVEIVLQRAKEKFPDERPRIISDNGPQFVAREFKDFIRLSGMTHVRTSAYYPQSNGKIERWHQSLKKECIRPQCPLSLNDAREVVLRFVTYYNCERLHSAIGYITPINKLKGREKQIFAERKNKLATAQKKRQQHLSNKIVKECKPVTLCAETTV